MSREADAPSVLLVDDTPSNLLALEAALAPLGARLVQASSGQEAVARVLAEPFAVALLDVQMPGMDGLETAAKIRASPNGRELPILFVTAIHGDREYAKRGYAAGAADYVTKPFDVDVLRARVKAFVDLFRQREQVRATEVALRTHERDEATRRLVAFERIAAAALETNDLESFLRRLLDIFIAAADAADSASILLREGDLLRASAWVGLDGNAEKPFSQPVGEGFAGQVATTRTLHHITNAAQSPAVENEWVRMHGPCGLLGVPLLNDGELLGVALIGSARADTFSPADQRLLQATAERAAWAVAKQRQRARLRDVLMAAPALICSVRGPAHVYEFANPAYLSLFGDVRLVGKPFAAHGARLELLPLLDAAQDRGEQVAVDELRTTVDGEEGDPRFFGVSVQPERGASGGVEGVLLFLVDITAHVSARRALQMHEKDRAHLLAREREARMEAEGANHMKDEFLATVSHELRTPLNAILGWSRLARANATPDTERALSIIERNAIAQAKIIEDVLDVSRIISGKLRLDPRPMRFELAIQGALEAVRPAAEAKQIELTLRLGALPEIIGDPDRIQQVVWNLLSNAVKFTPKAGRVELDVQAQGDQVSLRMTDTGQGIDPTFLPHVFDAFRQADGSTTRRHGGLGLGLAIVKQLVHAHGGTLRADSDGIGRGATFTVSFPSSDGLLAAPPRAFATASHVAAPQVRLDDVKVLVVDDEEDARMLLVEILRKQGAATMTAGSAKEALDELGRFHPDVLVSDIGMPEADGYMLLERIRRLDAGAGGRTPAVALTAYARPEDAARALRAGFQTHLAKPVDAGRLISAIARLSAGPRPARA